MSFANHHSPPDASNILRPWLIIPHFKPEASYFLGCSFTTRCQNHLISLSVLQSTKLHFDLFQWAKIILVIEQTVTTDERRLQQINYSQPMNDKRRALVIRWHQTVSLHNQKNMFTLTTMFIFFKGHMEWCNCQILLNKIIQSVKKCFGLFWPLVVLFNHIKRFF